MAMADRFSLPDGRIFRGDGRIIDLTAIQAALLGLFYKHRGHFVAAARQALVIYGSADGPDDVENTLAVHRCKLRQKVSGCSFRLEHKREYGDAFFGELELSE